MSRLLGYWADDSASTERLPILLPQQSTELYEPQDNHTAVAAVATATSYRLHNPGVKV
jgi:hypothetical protein